MSITEEIRAALAELGDDADGIAAKLADLGIKGRCTHGRACPLYVYLNRRVPLVTWVTEDSVWWSTDSHSVDLTPDQREFVSRFDRGQYPDLVGDPR